MGWLCNKFNLKIKGIINSLTFDGRSNLTHAFPYKYPSWGIGWENHLSKVLQKASPLRKPLNTYKYSGLGWAYITSKL